MIKETLSTSEKEVPKINLGLEEKYKEEAKAEKNKEPLNPENIKSSRHLTTAVLIIKTRSFFQTKYCL